MRTSSIESAIKAIKSNKSLISTYAHYVCVKGRCTVEEASHYVQEDMGIWGESGMHYDVIAYVIESMINNFFDDMWENSNTLEEEETELNDFLLDCLESEEKAVNNLMASEVANADWYERCEQYLAQV